MVPGIGNWPAPWDHIPICDGITELYLVSTLAEDMKAPPWIQFILSSPALTPVSRRLERSVPHLRKLGKAAIGKQGYMSQQLMADVTEKQKAQSLEGRRDISHDRLSLST